MDWAEVKKIIDSYDQNGDGRVDRIEFKHFMTELMKKELIEQQDSIIEITNMFHDSDINKDGVLTFDELYNLFNKINPEITRNELMILMKEIDENNDG